MIPGSGAGLGMAVAGMGVAVSGGMDVREAGGLAVGELMIVVGAGAWQAARKMRKKIACLV
jgi:hypothetical protein